MIPLGFYLLSLMILAILAWIGSLERRATALTDRVTQLEEAVTKPAPPSPRRAGFQ